MLLLLVLLTAGALAVRPPRGPSRALRPDSHPGVENCTVHWFQQARRHAAAV